MGSKRKRPVSSSSASSGFDWATARIPLKDHVVFDKTKPVNPDVSEVQIPASLRSYPDKFLWKTGDETGWVRLYEDIYKEIFTNSATETVTESRVGAPKSFTGIDRKDVVADVAVIITEEAWRPTVKKAQRSSVSSEFTESPHNGIRLHVCEVKPEKAPLVESENQAITGMAATADVLLQITDKAVVVYGEATHGSLVRCYEMKRERQPQSSDDDFDTKKDGIPEAEYFSVKHVHSFELSMDDGMKGYISWLQARKSDYDNCCEVVLKALQEAASSRRRSGGYLVSATM
eukprot:TRINITY_DN49451_c0_g1_i1.p1 TRINITY_DN49451_c0_g1~~TRINITY_DN49451_c0_g1_i1.p1  ORF type:complete len:289 (-),score=18.05 TRINITY_DN49451_c0_g1_i1:105-971(-)